MSFLQLLTAANKVLPDIASSVANISQRHPFVSVAPDTTLIEALNQFGLKGIKQVGVVDVASGKIKKFITISAVADLLLQVSCCYWCLICR
eukprot:m.48199 g.48199  ORF g.48199 m.48199 type:complete len:91 (+) comp11020_c0_seq2:738-1010(+)